MTTLRSSGRQYARIERWITIYVVFHDGVFIDVFASYSEASLNCPVGKGWEIKRYQRQEY